MMAPQVKSSESSPARRKKRDDVFKGFEDRAIGGLGGRLDAVVLQVLAKGEPVLFAPELCRLRQVRVRVRVRARARVWVGVRGRSRVRVRAR